MPCIVGITTDPSTRRTQWQSKVVGLSSWQILTSYENRSEAQAFDTEFAKSHGCQAFPGGVDTLGTWYVYPLMYS